MKPEKAMQMKHATIICLHSSKVIADLAEAPSLVCSYKVFEKSIHLSLEKNGRADWILINKSAVQYPPEMRCETVQYLCGHSYITLTIHRKLDTGRVC